MNGNNKVDLLFEEYKIIRETAINFDKILLEIRKSTISIAFIIFGIAIGIKGVEANTSGFISSDLAIALIVIEILMVILLFYVEIHYRTYLTRIANLAGIYEEELKLGIYFKDKNICELDCSENETDIKKGSISKCLKCEHDTMGFFTRIAHYNIYISLMTLGMIFFNVLFEKKIGLSNLESLTYSIFIGLIIFSTFQMIAKYNIQSKKNTKFDNEIFFHILISILYIILIYLINHILDYLKPDFNNYFFFSVLVSTFCFLLYFIIIFKTNYFK
ncbi:MAG: hypothetical protein KAT05_03070 [Spirochaetes bacterium]|nr:hypothetical protein [Spirochaetota bacterium]